MKLRRLLLWTLIVFALDQGTKLLVSLYIPYGTDIPIIPNIFDIVHVTNKGAAFGLFGTLPDPWRFTLITAVSLLAVVMIVYYYWSVPFKDKSIQIPLALILGGAAGNIFDRVFRGAVIDFLSFHWYDEWVKWEFGRFFWHFKLEWPSFNVADMAISMSVVWLLVIIAKRGQQEKRETENQ